MVFIRHVSGRERRLVQDILGIDLVLIGLMLFASLFYS